jgi:hypothetical protein
VGTQESPSESHARNSGCPTCRLVLFTMKSRFGVTYETVRSLVEVKPTAPQTSVYLISAGVSLVVVAAPVAGRLVSDNAPPLSAHGPTLDCHEIAAGRVVQTEEGAKRTGCAVGGDQWTIREAETLPPPTRSQRNRYVTSEVTAKVTMREPLAARTPVHPSPANPPLAVH